LGEEETIVPYDDVPEPIEEEQEDTTIEHIYGEWEGIASASVRRGLRSLTKQQMHEKLLHTGEGGNCAICRTLRRGRPHDKMFRRKLDTKAGRTINMDILTGQNEEKTGEITPSTRI
jgi:hypothetical protein